MRLSLTLAAEDDLQNIRNALMLENPAAADRVREAIRRTLMLLTDFPKIGRTGSVPGTREKVLSGYPYVIVYGVQSEEIIILRIYHAAQNRRR